MAYIVDFICVQVVGNLTPSEHVADDSGLEKCYAASLGTKFLGFRRFVFGIFLISRATINYKKTFPWN